MLYFRTRKGELVRSRLGSTGKCVNSSQLSFSNRENTHQAPGRIKYLISSPRSLVGALPIQKSMWCLRYPGKAGRQRSHLATRRQIIRSIILRLIQTVVSRKVMAKKHGDIWLASRAPELSLCFYAKTIRFKRIKSLEGVMQ